MSACYTQRIVQKALPLCAFIHLLFMTTVLQMTSSDNISYGFPREQNNQHLGAGRLALYEYMQKAAEREDEETYHRSVDYSKHVLLANIRG